MLSAPGGSSIPRWYHLLSSHLETPANGQALVFLTGLLEVSISEISYWQQYRITLSVINPESSLWLFKFASLLGSELVGQEDGTARFGGYFQHNVCASDVQCTCWYTCTSICTCTYGSRQIGPLVHLAKNRMYLCVPVTCATRLHIVLESIQWILSANWFVHSPVQALLPAKMQLYQ